MMHHQQTSVPARTVRALLFAALLLPLLCDTAAAQGIQIDENWTLTCNGQTVVPNPDGTFTITNVAAPDLFGAGGPGTAPDFLSDDFVRLTGIGVVDGITYYCFSDPFQIQNNVTFELGEITITSSPPPLPETLRIFSDQSAIEIAEGVQLQVIGFMGTGTQEDLTNRDTWTVYRTSNADIAFVDEDGLVTGNAEGVAFITAVNGGATAVIRIDVVQATVDTTVEGFVQLDDGTPLDAATVSTSFGGTATTDVTGFFSFSVTLPAGSTVTILATGDDSGTDVTGGVSEVPVVADGITDAGIIVAAAAVIWVGPGSGDWNDPANWSTGQLPQPDENVVIDFAGNIVEINIPSGTVIDIGSLTSNENVTLRTGATLSVDTIIQITAQFDINGGTLKNATILPGSNGEGLEISGHCTLDNLTLECDVDITVTSRSVTCLNGLTINGIFTTSSSASIWASGGQTFGGTGELFFAQFGYLRRTGGGVLTIGPDLLVRGYGYMYAPLTNNGTFRCDQDGRTLWFFNSTTGSPLINNGVMECSNGGDLDIRVNPFTNNGTVTGDGANTLVSITGAVWTNNGSIATTNGATLTLSGDWDDNGTISVTDGTLNFGRTNFDTDDFAGITTVNSTFNLTSGTFNNSDNIFAPGNAYNIGTITIVGGILQAPVGEEIVITGNPTFDNLEIDGNITASSRAIYIQNGFTLNGTFSLTYCQVYWRGTQLCDGAADFNLVSGWNYFYRQNGGTTTYGANVVVRHTSTIGHAYIYGPLVNNGEFRSEGGLTMHLWGTDWHNAGSLVGTDSSLRIDANGFVNQATGSVDVTGGTLFLLNNWTDLGGVDVTDSLLNLGGSIVPSDLLVVNRVNSGINLYGATLDNSGNNFTLSEDMDFLANTRVTNGEITVPAAYILSITGTTTFDNLDLTGDLKILGGSILYLQTAFTLDDKIDVQHGQIYTTGTMTVDGAGEILLGSTSWGYLRHTGAGTTTFETDITIRTGSGSSWAYFYGPFNLKGTLLNEVNGRWLFLQGSSGTNNGLIRCADGGMIQVNTNPFTNNGTMECDNGSTLQLQSTTWTNTADIDATGGSTLRLAGSWTDTGSLALADSVLDMGSNFTVATLNSITRTNSGLAISGTFDLETATYSLVEDVDLRGTIKNGTLTVPIAHTLQLTGHSTLDGITLSGDIDVPNGFLLYLTNGLTLNGTITLMSAGSWTYLLFLSTMTIDGTGDIVFGGTAQYNRLDSSSTLYTYTLGPNITVREGRGYLYNKFVLQGTVRSDGAGQWKQIGTNSTNVAYGWSNEGAIEVLNGAETWFNSNWTNESDVDVTNGSTLRASGSWTDNGNIVVTDSTLYMSGSYTSDEIGGFSLTNSALNLSGTMDNTGLTYTATQAVNLTNLTVTGGTLDVSGAGTLSVAGTTTLDGVQLDGDLEVLNSRRLNYRNGLAINGTLTLSSVGSWTYLWALNTQTIAGTGDIVFGGTRQYNRLDANNAVTYTIGSGITIREGRGYIYEDFVLEGTIESDGASQWKLIGEPSSIWSSTGTISVLNGAASTLNGTWSNPGAVTVDATSNITASGTYGPDAIESFDAPGTVNLAGTLSNAGDTFNPPTTWGAINLSGVTIDGGTFDIPVGLTVGMTSHSTLDSVTLEGDLTVPNGVILYYRDGLTLNGTITLASVGSWTYLWALNTQTISGTGDIIFGGTHQLNRLDANNAVTYTIGSGITIRGGRGYIYEDFALEGTIESDGASQWKLIGEASSAWSSTGTINVLNGATTTLNGTWSNPGTVSVDATSSITTAGSYGPAAVEGFNALGTVNLGGTMNNAGDTFAPPNTWGALNLSGVTIDGGTFDIPGGLTVGMTSHSTLDSVTLEGDLTVPNGVILYYRDGLTLNGTITLASVGSWTYLWALNTQTISGTGDIIFGGTHPLNRLDANNAVTYTIGSGITIREGRGYIYEDFVLDGTIRSDGASQWKLIGEGSSAWSGSGTIEALNGATSTTNGTWSFPGTTTVDATSTLTTNGTYGSTDIESMDIAGTLNLSGAMTNTAATFSPSATWGTLNFLGVTVNGGTVDIPTGLNANSTSSNTRFDGVTLVGDLNIVNGAWLRLKNGFTNNGKITLSSVASWTYIYFEGTQTMGGTGAVDFAGTSTLNRFDGSGGTVYTIGASISVDAVTSSGHFYRDYVIDGTVNCDGAGHHITFNGTTRTNNGSIGCTGGGTITINGAFANDGTFSIGSDCIFTMNGALTLSGTSNLIVGIDGTGAGNFGVMNFNTSIALDGTLELVFDPGGSFSATDSFNILNYTSATNDFSSLIEQNTPAGLATSTAVGATAFTVTLN